MKKIKTVSTLAFLFCLLSTAQISFAQASLEDKYEEVKRVNHKIFIARKDSLWGVVDQTNTVQLPFEYKSISLNEAVYKYILQGQNGKMGFVDVIFDKIIPPTYDSITIFNAANRNYLKCWSEGTASVFNQQMRLLFTQNCTDFIPIPGKADLFLIKGKNQKWGLVNSQDKMQIPFAYDALIYQPNLQVNIKTKPEDLYFFSAKKGDKYGLINFKNTILIPLEYDYIEVLNENHIIAKKNGKYGSIDQKENIVIPFRYNQMERFTYHGGQGPFVKVQNERNLAGLYDRTGKLIIEEKYLFEKIKLSDEMPGYSIEVSDGVNDYFATFYNDLELIPFIKKEPIGGNNVNGVYIYTHPNGMQCIVGAHGTRICNNSFEWFDSVEKITKDSNEFLILEKKGALGKKKYGIREVHYGKCMSSIIFDSLDFNITEEHIQYFKPQRNEVIIAVGKIKKNRSKWIVSNFGVKEIKR